MKSIRRFWFMIALLSTLAVSGCVVQGVQPLPEGEGIEEGVTYFLDKERLHEHRQPAVSLPWVAYRQVMRAEPGSDMDQVDLFLVNLDTGERVRVTESPATEQRPQIDAPYIVWTVQANGTHQLHAYDMDTGEQRLLHEQEEQFRYYSVSGSHVLWAKNGEDSQPTLHMMDVEGTEGPQTIHDGFAATEGMRAPETYFIAPSIDDGRIVFVEQVSWDENFSTYFSHLWRMGIEGEEPVRLTDEPVAYPFTPQLRDDQAYFTAQPDPREPQFDLFVVEEGQVRTVASSELREADIAVTSEGIAYRRDDPRDQRSSNEIVWLEDGGETVIDEIPISVHHVDAEGRVIVWQTWGGPRGSEIFIHRMP